MYENNRPIQIAWLIALLLTPIILWILPGGFFDDSNVIICPSRLLFDFECFGCGMTRAVQHMHNFEFEDALYYNMGVVAVYPGLIYVWGLWTYRAWNRIKQLKVA